jgi:hypothetical protein
MALGSPGVETREIDLTTVIPASAPSVGSYAGRFNWGPIGQPRLVSSEDVLGELYGKPKSQFCATEDELNGIATSFMTVASYLAYSNGVYVSRVANVNDSVELNNAVNAVSTLTVGDSATPTLIKNIDDYREKESLGGLGQNFAIAKYAGTLGNSIAVSAVFTAQQYRSSEILPAETFTLEKSGVKRLSIDSGSSEDLRTVFMVGDRVSFTYNNTVYENTVKSVSEFVITLEDIGAQYPSFPASATSGVVVDVTKAWKFASLFTGAPSTNEFHVIVYDATGLITGEVGAVLEKYDYLSNDIGARDPDGVTAYYKTVLNGQSSYIWVGGVDISNQFASTSVLAYNESLAGGRNGTEPTVDDYIDANAVFLDLELIIDFIITPPLMGSIGGLTLPAYLIQNIAEVRKDCVVYLSPRYTDVVNAPKHELKNVIEFRNALPSTSYAFMDCNWKYMYDRYNNVYRWIPLSGDTSGCSARTDNENDTWWSNAGYNRGIIKNAERLAWNPSQTPVRDALYAVGVNPVLTINRIGSVLMGDKTMLDRPSAFDRINVRRLFITLRRAISKSAKYSLFEFNDEITRNRFISMVEPYLREVKARRGLTDFLVVCDGTNNTAQVIDTNRFIGDIYLKPTRSINYITLNFINTPTGVDFQEVVGKY